MRFEMNEELFYNYSREFEDMEEMTLHLPVSNHTQNSTTIFQIGMENPAKLRKTVITVNWITFAYVMLSNSVLIFGLRKTNKKLSMSKRLFVYLSCADILLAIMML